MTDDELYDMLRARVADATDPNETRTWAAALRDVAVAIGVRRQNPQFLDVRHVEEHAESRRGAS